MFDIQNIDSIDLRLRLLCGDFLSTGYLNIYPLTTREVKDEGYVNYNRHLGVLLLTKEDLIKEDLPEIRELTVFDIMLFSGNELLVDALISSLCFFLRENKEDVSFFDGSLIFGTQDLDKARKVNSGNFDSIVEIVKHQNCVVTSSKSKSEEEEALSKMSDKARQIAEKMKKSKKEVAKAKAKNSEDIDFADILSAVSTKSNTYNKHTIWDATIYQVYDEYKRLEMISGYETNILAMIQGAKIDNLKHWSSKMEE
jgi:hypothetical protein